MLQWNKFIVFSLHTAYMLNFEKKTQNIIEGLIAERMQLEVCKNPEHTLHIIDTLYMIYI